jgi:hypothetical protein
METVQIEFEPFINEGARQFIVNGVDNYNIVVTSLPDYFPINFVLRGERGDVLGGDLWRMPRPMLAFGVQSGRHSRLTASRLGHFMSDLATRCLAHSTGILLDTPSTF